MSAVADLRLASPFVWDAMFSEQRQDWSALLTVFGGCVRGGSAPSVTRVYAKTSHASFARTAVFTCAAETLL